MTNDSQSIARQLVRSIAASQRRAEPYPHWFLEDCLPADVADEITELIPDKMDKRHSYGRKRKLTLGKYAKK